mgnify:CR=1 FL=1
MLSVEGLTKTYGERQLFADLTFGVQEGERVALVARNGSGSIGGSTRQRDFARSHSNESQ